MNDDVDVAQWPRSGQNSAVSGRAFTIGEIESGSPNLLKLHIPANVRFCRTIVLLSTTVRRRYFNAARRSSSCEAWCGAREGTPTGIVFH